MIKRCLPILLIVLLFFNCGISKKPVFEKVAAIKIINSTSKSITLSADAFFKNPNNVSGVLKTDGIKIYVNDNEIAYIVSEEFDVPKKASFKIPLTAIIDTHKLTKKTSLENLISSLLSQKIKVQFKGQLKYKVFGFTSTYDIDKTEDLKIKL
jgi:hypothetical protein